MARAWRATSTRSRSSPHPASLPRCRGCPNGRSLGGSGMPLTRVATAAPDTSLQPIAQVAVEARVGSQTGLFDYAVPEALTGVIEDGHRVRVPFGKRTVTGFVYALDQGPTVLALKPIEALLDAEPVLPTVLVELAGFVAAHYLVPLDEVVRAVVPPRVRAVVRRSVKRRRQSRILRQAAQVSQPAAIA